MTPAAGGARHQNILLTPCVWKAYLTNFWTTIYYTPYYTPYYQVITRV